MPTTTIRSTSVIGALKALLEADGTFTQQITHGVYAHRLASPPPDTAWSRAVIREAALPEGLLEHPTGTITLPLQLMIECAGYPDPDLLLEAAHETAAAALHGQRPETDYGDVIVPLERARRPTTAQWDSLAQCYRSTATFYVTASTN